MQLCEKYRPQCWEEVVGQDAAVARIRQLAARGKPPCPPVVGTESVPDSPSNGNLAGRAYWISGLSGTGKTTIARLLAAALAPIVED